MKPLRIGIIANLRNAVREPFAGGLEMHTHLLARELLERGHSVRVFCAQGSDPCISPEFFHYETLNLNPADFPLNESSAYIQEFMDEKHAYLRLMHRLRTERFDVIHNNSLHYMPVSLADTLHCPMVTSLHTPPFPWLQSAVRIAVEEGNSHFVAVSQSTKSLWSRYIPDCRVIPNGVPIAAWPFGSERPNKTLFWHGRIVPEKGTHLALQTALKTGLPLRFAGPVSDTRYFENKVKPLMAETTNNQIEYLGHLNHKQIANELGKASVFLSTACWNEPFGLVIAEALACGTPVAGFDRGAIRELVTLETGVIALPADTSDLARAVHKAQLLSREACRRYAISHLSAQRMADEYEALYYELAAKRRRKPLYINAAISPPSPTIDGLKA